MRGDSGGRYRDRTCAGVSARLLFSKQSNYHSCNLPNWRKKEESNPYPLPDLDRFRGGLRPCATSSKTGRLWRNRTAVFGFAGRYLTTRTKGESLLLVLAEKGRFELPCRIAATITFPTCADSPLRHFSLILAEGGRVELPRPFPARPLSRRFSSPIDLAFHFSIWCPPPGSNRHALGGGF